MVTICSQSRSTSPTHGMNPIGNVCMGMLSHSRRSAASNFCRFSGCTRWLWTRLASSSLVCSMGDTTGDTAGHCMTLMLLLARNCRVILAVWGVALSCWKIMGFCWLWIKGSTIAFSTLFTYKTALRLPGKTTNRSLWFYVMPPHTITLRWNRFTSPTHASENRSPVRRYTRILPSWCKENRDSYYIIV